MASNGSAVALRPVMEITSEERFTHEDIELVRATVCKGASDAELRLFLNQCVRTGLDPLARQIYSVPRGNGRTIQTGIDGYRLIAQRTGEYAGSDDAIYDAETEDHPNRATVTVWRLVEGVPRAFTATARWSEYKPAAGQDQMWQKMPYLMIAKCAEALALRKAFPQELSGIYTDAEMDQATTVDGTAREIRTGPVVVRTAPRAPVGGSSRSQLRETVANATRPVGSPDARDRSLRFAASGEPTIKATVAPTPALGDEDDDVLRDELRELGTRGFDLERFLSGRNKELDDLTREELAGILPTARGVVQKRVERLMEDPLHPAQRAPAVPAVRGKGSSTAQA
jgi:phage recombination protein Bet